MTAYTLHIDKAPVVSSGYVATAVHADGSVTMSDGATRSVVNSKTLVCSFWFKLAAPQDGTASLSIFWKASGPEVLFQRRSDDRWINDAQNTDSPTITVMQQYSDTSITSALGWMHVISSIDLANDYNDMYINGVQNRTASVTIHDGIIDWNVSATVFLLNSCICDVADFWLTTKSALDLGVAANVQKFRSPTGKPVDLGADGSTPTSVQPDYFFGGSGATAGNWDTNKGSAGAVPIVGGSLTAASSSPSD